MRHFIICIALLLCFNSARAFDFSIHPLDAKQQDTLIEKNLWQLHCPVPLTRLRDVHISYYDFSGNPHDNGHLIVMDVAAPHVVAIFKSLYQQKFPIHKIVPTSAYQGDDNRSMEDNNTSGFNCRPVTGGNIASIHGYGLAIDINTIQNPFILFAKDKSGLAQVMPYQGIDFVNRRNQRPGMVESVADLFARHGLSVWGGDWDSPIDYQHFQTSRIMAELLALLKPTHAKELYELSIRCRSGLSQLHDKDFIALKKEYEKNPEWFINTLKKRFCSKSSKPLSS